jgi:hypothetical protein
MVSSNEARLDPREKTAPVLPCLTGRRTSAKTVPASKHYRGLAVAALSQKVGVDQPSLPYFRSGYRRAREGSLDNRHLNHLAECTYGNVGSAQGNAKACSLPMSPERDGAAVVVRGWESQPHSVRAARPATRVADRGEGRQFDGTSGAKVADGTSKPAWRNRIHEYR